MIKFTADRAILARHLKTALAYADLRSTMPALACVALRVDGGTLSITATDLAADVAMSMQVTAAKPGALLVDAKAISDVVSAMPAADVTITGMESHGCEIRSGKVTTKIVGLNARDAAKVYTIDRSDASSNDVDCQQLVAVMRAVATSMSQDATRIHLCGMLIEPGSNDEKRVAIVATDGHRLHIGVADVPGLTRPIIIPSGGVAKLVKLLADTPTAKVAIDAKRIGVTVDGVTVTIALADAQFPPWRQVSDQADKSAGGRTIAIDLATIGGAMKRGALMATSSHGVKIALVKDEDHATLTASTPDRGTVSEGVELVEAWPHQTIAVTVNPAYFADALATIAGDTVTISVGGELDPLVVSSSVSSVRCVIMPMRGDS